MAFPVNREASSRMRRLSEILAGHSKEMAYLNRLSPRIRLCFKANGLIGAVLSEIARRDERPTRLGPADILKQHEGLQHRRLSRSVLTNHQCRGATGKIERKILEATEVVDVKAFDHRRSNRAGRPAA